MEDNKDYASDLRNLQRSSNLENTSPLDPFVSTVLTRLGLGDISISKDSSGEPLLKGLSAPEWQVRAAAARKLGTEREQAGVAPLATILLNDEAVEVKIAAARALGELADSTSVESLIAALHDPSDEVKAAAAWALGELGAHVLRSTPLENLLNTDDVSVRVAAIRALGKLEERTPIPILIAALQDPGWQVREIAAMLLKERRDCALQDAFATLLDDDSWFVRKTAIKALTMIWAGAAANHGPPQAPPEDMHDSLSPTDSSDDDHEERNGRERE